MRLKELLSKLDGTKKIELYDFDMEIIFTGSQNDAQEIFGDYRVMDWDFHNIYRNQIQIGK